MASISTPIDLSLLPSPDAVEFIDYEKILSERKTRLLDLTPAERRDALAATLALESEPITILLQENALREMTLRQRINEAARGVLLPTSRGADLDNLGAANKVTRLLVRAEDRSVFPPIEAVYETDESLRERIPDAFEGMSVAGPVGAYRFHAKSADGAIADVQVISPKPCQITVAVLSRDGDGFASTAMLAKVRAALNVEDVVPLCDEVTVQSSEIVNFSVHAKLHLKSIGPGRAEAVAEARKNVLQFVGRMKRQGASIWQTALTSLMHVEGVERVELLTPATDIVLTPLQAGTCTAVSIEVAPEIYGD